MACTLSQKKGFNLAFGASDSPVEFSSPLETVDAPGAPFGGVGFNLPGGGGGRAPFGGGGRGAGAGGGGGGALGGGVTDLGRGGGAETPPSLLPDTTPDDFAPVVPTFTEDCLFPLLVWNFLLPARFSKP